MTSYGARMSRWPQPRTEGRDSGLVALMEGESVSSITSRSIPMPSPPIHSIRRTETLPTDRRARGPGRWSSPVGGMPCSSAVRKSSSTPHACG